jgi:hypothetical protein
MGWRLRRVWLGVGLVVVVLCAGAAFAASLHPSQPRFSASVFPLLAGAALRSPLTTTRWPHRPAAAKAGSSLWVRLIPAFKVQRDRVLSDVIVLTAASILFARMPRPNCDLTSRPPGDLCRSAAGGYGSLARLRGPRGPGKRYVVRVRRTGDCGGRTTDRIARDDYCRHAR